MDTAGLHDPYWYEGSVGLLSVIDMLNPDSEIESVTFQKTGAKGLDDVVIAHRNGRTIYTQIKHTRADNPLTFGDLVSRPSAENGQEGGKSLLAHIAEAWREARSECEFAEARIYTNRSTSNHPYRDRPALAAFWQRLSEQIQGADDLGSISFPTDWQGAWENWLAQIECLGDDAGKLEFLKVLHLDADQGGLEELDRELRSRLREVLGVTEEQAAELLSSLYAALRKWTTSLRNDQAITAEDVWKVIGANEVMVGVHALPPPAPFFPSRIGFLDQVATALRGTSQAIIFLTGEPGCGKTSIVSALVNRSDPIIDLRYHAYRPITPDMADLSIDTGETATAEVLWGDLLIQLRRHLAGRLAYHRVPLRISFLSVQDRRREVLRLASALAEERGHRVVIAIDGIDHAARANRTDRLPFLDSLPEPDEVPDDVCFFLVGQPPEAWPAYPYWLREASSAVETYHVPQVDYEDIRTLLADRVLPIEPDVHDALVRVIADVTEYNTLSVVFAVEEAVELPQPRELHEHLRQRALAGSLRNYYDGIWGNATVLLSRQLFNRERIAACVAVAREHLTGQLLSHVFTDDSVSPHDWNEVLRNLRPLLVEDECGFRVLHNDVRVHLTLYAGADQSRLREISNLFLRYYEGDVCTPEARHSHLFEFARLAGELEKASAAYTPLWVAEAAALDRP
ncbi:MAG: ATP-binding protein, partial [Desulfococcaceae bacterium]